jgi:lysophospholipase L1-like esterase
MPAMSVARTPTVRRSGRKILPRVLLVLFGLVAGLIIELGLRVVGRSVERDAAAPDADVPADMHTVILCVGDSHTAGSQAPAGLDYPSQLEIALNLADRGRGFRVINLGRPGDNSSQAVDRAIRYLAAARRRPDVIVFNAGFNNCWNFADASALPPGVAHGSRRAQFRYLLASSRALRFSSIVVSRLRQLAGGAREQTEAPQRRSVLGDQNEAEVSFLADWEFQDLARLAQETARRKIGLALLTYWNDVRWMDQAYQRLAAERGATVIDVRNFGSPITELETTGPVPLVARDSHPNKFGYARIARLVAQALVDRGLIPRPQAPKP